MKYLSEVTAEGGFSAKVVASSVANNIPIHTLELRYPRVAHAELMTHRQFSRGASSSRAKSVGRVIGEGCYLPVDLRSPERGMQGYDRVDHDTMLDLHEDLKIDYDRMVQTVAWYKDRVHKQHLNRYLEPWSYIDVLVTATEWDNFFSLRLQEDVYPEMHIIAEIMAEAIELAEPTILRPGEWHLPYVDDIESVPPTADLRMLSATRCAWISYSNQGKVGKDIGSQLSFAEKLLQSRHMSPFEHQATPMPEPEESWRVFAESDMNTGITHVDRNWEYWSNNFRGWIQHRALL